jgi:hypothetical protein
MQITYSSRAAPGETRSFRTVAAWLSVWGAVLSLLASL